MYREEFTAKAGGVEDNQRERNENAVGDSPMWNVTNSNLEEVAVMYMQRVATILDSIRN